MMGKRAFRAPPPAPRVSYPTLESFDRGSRRSFLGKLGALGAVLLGAGALAGCDSRAAPASPDAGGPSPDGMPPQPPPPKPQPKTPDFGIAGGRAAPDISTLEGDVAGPDARIDDLGAPSPGFAPQMDARVDGCSLPDPEPTP